MVRPAEAATAVNQRQSPPTGDTTRTETSSDLQILDTQASARATASKKTHEAAHEAAPEAGELEAALWVSPKPLWEAVPGDVMAGRPNALCPEPRDSDRPRGSDTALPRKPEGLGTPQPPLTGTGLNGPWRLLLLGDGSPTRHLQLLTGLPVRVEVITMASDPLNTAEAPAEVSELEPPLLRRQVWLRCGDHTLAWAESWWNCELAAKHLGVRSRPIWHSLTANRAELYREVDGLAVVSAPHLESGFGHAGPFWSRHYRFFRAGRPLTVIREVFSPELGRWLGACCREGSPGSWLAAHRAAAPM